jgi:hypothetical protein
MQSLAHVMPAALVELLRSSPMSAGKAQFAWQAAVGPAVDRATAVRLEGDLLIVDTQSAQWAHEIKRSTGVILARLQQLLGPNVVNAIAVRSR